MRILTIKKYLLIVILISVKFMSAQTLGYLDGIFDIKWGDSRAIVIKKMFDYTDTSNFKIETERKYHQETLKFYDGIYLENNVSVWKFEFYKNQLYGITVEYSFTEDNFREKAEKIFDKIVKDYGMPDNFKYGDPIHFWKIKNDEDEYSIMAGRSPISSNHLIVSYTYMNLAKIMLHSKK